MVKRGGTAFGFLMPCWYSYSYHNNSRYIFGRGDMTCLRSSKRSLKPSKTKYPLGKHPNNLMPYKVIPRYGLGATLHGWKSRCRHISRYTVVLPSKLLGAPRVVCRACTPCITVESLVGFVGGSCLLYTSPSPRDLSTSRMPSSA